MGIGEEESSPVKATSTSSSKKGRKGATLVVSDSDEDCAVQKSKAAVKTGSKRSHQVGHFGFGFFFCKGMKTFVHADLPAAMVLP